MKKNCVMCKKIFSTPYEYKKYCSVDCRSTYQKSFLITKNKLKFCKKCGNKKTFSQAWYCRDCTKLIVKEGYEKHKKRARKNALEYYNKIKNSQFYRYRRNERYKIYHKKRRDNDPEFKVAIRLRNLLYSALTKYTKEGKAFSSKRYGIDFNKIVKHLKPFPKNQGKWHIDHIIPLSSFNLKNPEEIKKAFAPENHQWLLASENIKKSNKINFRILE